MNSGDSPDIVVCEKPNVTFDDVCGLTEEKGIMKEVLVLPCLFPDLFKGIRISSKVILLYGPSGSGKKSLVKAAASEGKCTIFSVSCTAMMSRYSGSPEQFIQRPFQLARENKPSIILIEDIDVLCKPFETECDWKPRLRTELVVQIHELGGEKDMVFIIATSCRPWDIDAFIRKRLVKRVYIPLPDREARTEMLKIHLKNAAHCITDEQFTELGQNLEGYSGADICSFAKDAIMQPIRKVKVATHFKAIHVISNETTRNGYGILDMQFPTISSISWAKGFVVRRTERSCFNSKDPPELEIPNCLCFVHKEYAVKNPSKEDRNAENDILWTPCSPEMPDAIEINWTEIEECKLLYPIVCKDDFLMSLSKGQSSVTKEELEKFSKFTEDFVS